MSAPEALVLINAFEVPDDRDEEFMAAWRTACQFLETRPGYLGTTLHEAVTPEAEFRFVNVARWQTAQQFQAVVTSDEFRAAAAGLAQFGSHPGLYRVIAA